MAVPTTHADLRTRTLALIVELDELNRGAYTLGFSGTAAQKAGAHGLHHELREAHKNTHKAGFGALTGQLQ